MPSPEPELFWTLLTQAQILWGMVGLQLTIFGVIWLVVARLNSDMRLAMRLMALFNAALAVNLILVALRGVVTDGLTRSPTNLMTLVAFAALWQGALRLVGVTPSHREPLLVVGVCGCGVVVFGLRPEWGSLRVAVTFVGVVWLVMRAWQLSRRQVLQRYGMGLSGLLTATAWVCAGVLLVKAVGGVWLGWPIDWDQTQSGPPLLPYVTLVLGTLINSVLAYVVVYNVLTQLNALNHQDALTQLNNRRAFEEQLARDWQRWRRRRGGFGVVCLDIDHFKQVNDRFGHQTGDVILTQVAQAMRSQVRPTDMLARTGGEEFVVLVHDEPAAGLLQLAERLRTAVARVVHTPDGQPVHISLGVAHCLATDAQAENVLSRADAALYRAKQQGRNRVEASPELALTSA